MRAGRSAQARRSPSLLAIAARPDFAFACGNPCDEFMKAGRPDYVGPFWFLWTDSSGELHATRIGKNATVLRKLTGRAAKAAR